MTLSLATDNPLVLGFPIEQKFRSASWFSWREEFLKTLKTRSKL